MRERHWVWLDHWGRAFMRFRIAQADARLALTRIRERGPRSRSWMTICCVEIRDAMEHLHLAISALVEASPWIVGDA